MCAAHKLAVEFIESGAKKLPLGRGSVVWTTQRSPTLVTLGRTVRTFREALGMTQDTLAAKLNYTNGWLSNFETGQHRPRADQVAAVEQALGLPPGALMSIYKQLDAEGLPTWTRPWIPEEEKASVLRTFQITLVPGLLQTKAYATALLIDEPLVEARLERQQILTRDDPEPPTLHCVLDEAVLYQSRGGPEVMREQLEHLIVSVSPPHLTVQIIRSEDNQRSLGAFTIATVRGGEVGYVETAIRGIVTSSREDLADLAASWEAIRTFALSQRESNELIKRVIEERWT